MKTLHFYADTHLSSKQARPVSITILAKKQFEHADPNRPQYNTSINMKPFTLYALGVNQYALSLGQIETGQKSLVAKLQDAGAFLADNRENYGLHNIFINFDDSIPSDIENIRWVLYGFKLGAYHYKYSPSHSLNQQTEELVAGDPIFASTTKWANDFATGVILAKELLNKPANIIYPETFVQAVKEIPFVDTTFSVLNEQAMRDQGFGGLLSVSQGSSHQANLLIMDYHPSHASHTIVLVGKGVTFDTANSRKRLTDPHAMKHEISGAAAVVGALAIIEKQKVPVRIIGLCGLVKNIDSEQALRPGDVVTMLNKQAIEIISTDAEGRLVLADMLTYAQNTYHPDFLLDIATLNANTDIALGKGFGGLMSNNKEFVQLLEKAAELTAEPIWSLPVGGWYKDKLISEFADWRHTSLDNEGSPSVAASFLENFINQNQKWAHLDITPFQGFIDSRPLYASGGATAFGVLLMVKLAKLVANQI